MQLDHRDSDVVSTVLGYCVLEAVESFDACKVSAMQTLIPVDAVPRAILRIEVMPFRVRASLILLFMHHNRGAASNKKLYEHSFFPFVRVSQQLSTPLE